MRFSECRNYFPGSGCGPLVSGWRITVFTISSAKAHFRATGREEIRRFVSVCSCELLSLILHSCAYFYQWPFWTSLCQNWRMNLLRVCFSFSCCRHWICTFLQLFENIWAIWNCIRSLIDIRSKLSYVIIHSSTSV